MKRKLAEAVLIAIALPAAAQIATDGTLTPPQDFSGPNFMIPSDAGARSGDVLSFSFSEFGVPDGGSATFVPGAGFTPVPVVVSRVTGGQPSSILGALRSQLGESHFYFLNPWGVFFGPNSGVDVGGSFHVTTADELRDGTGQTFSARSPTSELLVAEPSTFGFLSPTPAPIRIEGGLALDKGQTLDVVGGDITVSGAFVSTPGGTMRFVSLGATGDVSNTGGELVPSAGVQLGSIQVLSDAIVSTSGLEPTGPIFSPPSVLLQNGLLLVVASNQVEAGDVVLGQNSSGSQVAVLRAPATGRFSAVARSLTIRDADIRARSFGSEAGIIRIDAHDSVSIEKQLSSSDVGLLARSETVDIVTFGGAVPEPGGELIFIPAGTFTLQATGDGSTIDVHTGDLSMSGGAQISATTDAAGRGGEISVVADRSVVISGTDTNAAQTPTALFSNSQGEGDAGGIHVQTPLLRLEDGGGIVAETTLDADAGDIAIDVGRLEITGGSQIDSTTSAESLAPGAPPTVGNGGSIEVHASNSILISGRSETDFSRISTFSRERTVGSAGQIQVAAPNLAIADGGAIAATTNGAGNGGSIALDVGELSLASGGGLLVNSTATSAALGGASPGAAGSIAIGAQQVELSSAEITAFAQEGPAPGEAREGNIAISAHDQVVLRDGSRVTSSVGAGLGGNIAIGGADLLVLEGGSEILAETQNGTGGAISLATQGVIPQLAQFGSSALQSAGFVPGVSGARISADAGTGNSGTITTTSPEVDIESQVTALDVSFLDASSRLQRACAARASGAVGSFRVSRVRDTSSPDGAPPEFDDLGRIAAGAAPDGGAIELADAARSALEAGDAARAAPLLDRAESQLASAAPPASAPLAIHLAKSRELLAVASADPAQRSAQLQRAFALLLGAAEQARASGDARQLSFALGDLGTLYEREGRTREALYLTRRAIEAAEASQTSNPLYRWHWQEGRLAWAEGRTDAALRSYARAVEIIEASRSERVAQYGGDALRFRRTVAPVYLDTVDALLQSSDRVDSASERQRRLSEAREVMEEYRGAELRDYFRDECVADIEARTVDLDRLLRRAAPTAAVVYPIPLADRLELLVTLPNGLVRRRVEVRADRLAETVAAFRDGVRRPALRTYYAPAQELYTWLVAPYAAELAAQNVDTLVFVPDAVLRTVPMAALYDGKSFLIERFALAVTPGFSLIDPEPLDPERARFLLAGLSSGGEVAGERFAPLPKVGEEIAAIHALYGGEVLLDDGFQAARFEQELAAREPTVVHVASHAVFSGDPSASFVVAHDGPITLARLGAVVAPRQYSEAPLELLVLSACATASGDEQAALGLAGVAVRAGARSAVGSLWSIPDEAAYQVVTGFYGALDEHISKAQALRRAQLALLEGESRAYRHPYYWSAYLLISDWL